LRTAYGPVYIYALCAAHPECFAQTLKQLEMIENSLRENAKIGLAEHGISPTLLLGNLPISVSSEKRQ